MTDTKYPHSQRCAKCGRELFPTAQWAYKRGSRYYCSWKCYRSEEPPKKTNPILPKVGDTIRILSMPGIPEYIGKTGVVEFYDCFGQLHGTWGKLVVVPQDDTYEIIGEKDNDNE